MTTVKVRFISMGDRRPRFLGFLLMYHPIFPLRFASLYCGEVEGMCVSGYCTWSTRPVMLDAINIIHMVAPLHNSGRY